MSEKNKYSLDEELEQLKFVLNGGGGVATTREAIRMSPLKRYVEVPSGFDEEIVQIVRGIVYEYANQQQSHDIASTIEKIV